MNLLIDINVPDRFSLWLTEDSYETVAHLNRRWADETIWEYARQRNQVIITHDTDYKRLAIASQPPSQVILLRTGNLRMRTFHTFMNAWWPAIKGLLLTHRLVEVFDAELTGLPL